MFLDKKIRIFSFKWTRNILDGQCECFLEHDEGILECICSYVNPQMRNLLLSVG